MKAAGNPLGANRARRAPLLVVLGLLLTACLGAPNRAGPDATPGASGPPTSVAAPPSAVASAATTTYVSHRFRVTLQIPSAWRTVLPDPDALDQTYDEPYRAADGFLRLSGLPGAGMDLDQLCAAEARRASASDGAPPSVARLQADGQPACAILPAADPAPIRTRQAALIVRYPHPFTSQTLQATFHYLLLRAERDQIGAFARTLRFAVAPQDYLESVLDYLTQYALTSDQVDWPSVRTRARRIGRNARTTVDTYAAITYAIYQLQNRHTTFAPPEQAAQPPSPYQAPTGRRVAGDIGYLNLPSFDDPQQMQAKRYATTAQARIRQIDQPAVCGWIVDLRANLGGNMAPMLVGVGPLLGEGVFGNFVYPHGKRQVLSYRAGRLLTDGVAGADGDGLLDGPAYQLTPAAPPVAVLVGGATASAGEIVLIAFIGRPNTRSFGEPTVGFTTGNAGIELFDGALLRLTTAFDADRTGTVYAGSIAPDQVIPFDPGQIGSDADPVVAGAVAWLRRQPVCSRA